MAKKSTYLNVLKESINEQLGVDTKLLDYKGAPFVEKILDYPSGPPEDFFETHDQASKVLSRYYFKEDDESYLDAVPSEDDTDTIEDELSGKEETKEDNKKELGEWLAMLEADEMDAADKMIDDTTDDEMDDADKMIGGNSDEDGVETDGNDLLVDGDDIEDELAGEDEKITEWLMNLREEDEKDEEPLDVDEEQDKEEEKPEEAAGDEDKVAEAVEEWLEILSESDESDILEEEDQLNEWLSLLEEEEVKDEEPEEDEGEKNESDDETTKEVEKKADEELKEWIASLDEPNNKKKKVIKEESQIEITENEVIEQLIKELEENSSALAEGMVPGFLAHPDAYGVDDSDKRNVDEVLESFIREMEDENEFAESCVKEDEDAEESEEEEDDGSPKEEDEDESIK